jgi:hypothetical protein
VDETDKIKPKEETVVTGGVKSTGNPDLRPNDKPEAISEVSSAVNSITNTVTAP